MQSSHWIIKSIQDQQLEAVLQLLSSLSLQCMFLSLELLFSNVCDVQYSECIFKINVASLSVFKAKIGRHCIELFRIKVVLLVYVSVCVDTNIIHLLT